MSKNEITCNTIIIIYQKSVCNVPTLPLLDVFGLTLSLDSGRFSGILPSPKLLNSDEYWFIEFDFFDAMATNGIPILCSGWFPFSPAIVNSCSSSTFSYLSINDFTPFVDTGSTIGIPTSLKSPLFCKGSFCLFLENSKLLVFEEPSMFLRFNLGSP